MPQPPSPSHPADLLGQTLRNVARRYRVPATPTAAHGASPANALAVAIDQARQALDRGAKPDTANRQRFVEALARLIQESMDPEHGDPGYQALVLAHQTPPVAEYMALQAHAEQDRRAVRAGANGMAHPAKLEPYPAGPQREALAQLHAAAEAGQWATLAGVARQLLAMPPGEAQGIPGKARLPRDLTRLLQGDALARLLRSDALAAGDAQVLQYQALRERDGPRAGSAEALTTGHTAQQRGAAVEALAAQALQALARRLDAAQASPGMYRVVTSMRAPSTLPGNPERAKTEWDAVLLQHAGDTTGAVPTPVWDVCLLLEAKASADAATADFSRLQRGLRLLSRADPDTVYAFATNEGKVLLSGDGLAALDAGAGTDDGGGDLPGCVLYCSDAPAPAAPHLLSAASRMQLLSEAPSLAYASGLAQGRAADTGALEAVWQQLLDSPSWRALLHQYAALHRVREWMVHVDDLRAAAQG
jgi:hypothetical protein